MCHLAKAWRVARGGLPAWVAWGYRTDQRGIFFTQIPQMIDGVRHDAWWAAAPARRCYEPNSA